MLRILFFSLFLLLTIPFVNAQDKNTKIDSLKRVVETSTNDSIKMIAYDNLRRATSYSDPKISRHYTEKFLEIATRLKDSFNIAVSNFYLGNSNVVSSNYETALSHYLISAAYFEKTKDSGTLSSVLNGIGAAYENSGNDSLSLRYFKRSQQISRSLGDLRRSAIALNNIGNIYKNRGDLETAKKYMENAVADIKTTNQLAYIHPLSLNLANTYVDLKEFDYAALLYEEVLVTVDTIQDIYSYGMSLRGLGTASLARENFPDGLKKLKRAHLKLKSSGFFDEAIATIPDLIKAYEANGQYKNGLILANQYQKLKDSIFSNEKDKNLSEALQKYEADKKDTELKLLKVEGEKNEKQKLLYLILALGGLIIAGLLAFFGYKNNQKNKKLNSQNVILERTIDEKNVLLKEVHHRVKNSFQIVSSLLYLQSENMEDKEGKIAIKEAENRVRSMVLIHQKLYNKDSLVGIDSKEYINDLVNDIFESHQSSAKHISYNANVEPIALDIETITPVGLILNELIVNVLKHAFTNSYSNKNLIINFRKESNKLVLKVIDNGQGFNKKINETSFGIKLMTALAKKLKADLVFNSEKNKGTEAVLTITKFKIL